MKFLEQFQCILINILKTIALPDFLTDVKLYLHSLDSNTKKEVTRYCVAYGGLDHKQFFFFKCY